MVRKEFLTMSLKRYQDLRKAAKSYLANPASSASLALKIMQFVKTSCLEYNTRKD
jgi:hypothetical protein